MVEFKRKIYKRGSSFETTIPMPILFDKDMTKRQVIVFQFDQEKKKWYVEVKDETNT